MFVNEYLPYSKCLKRKRLHSILKVRKLRVLSFESGRSSFESGRTRKQRAHLLICCSLLLPSLSTLASGSKDTAHFSDDDDDDDDNSYNSNDDINNNNKLMIIVIIFIIILIKK